MSKLPTRSNFGASVSTALTSTGMSPSALAEKTGKSRSYVSQTMSGHRPPSPEWVDLIADTIGAGPKKRQEMHRAAAKDHGFKIDLG